MIRVLIVDDSAFVRKALMEALESIPGITVVGSACDPYAARDLILTEKPHVLTLDIEMPKMDGLTFLAKLMKHHPLPVVIVSSLAPENSATALRALDLGAVAIVSKPGSQYSIPDVARDLARAIRQAAGANIARITPGKSAASPQEVGQLRTTNKILAVGASTGGTNAIETFLSGMPASSPGTVIVQHMPAGFTGSFADRLNSSCAMTVREARDGEPISPGLALVAPGGMHLLVVRSGAAYLARVKAGPPVNHHKPSVDVLFNSVAEGVGPNAMGVILTGMGNDGARGMLAMRQAGARTFAQDEATCVVFGMPKQAIEIGGAEETLSLTEIAPRLCNLLFDKGRSAA